MLQRVIHGWLEIVGQSVRPHVDAWQKWISLILRLVSMILFRIPSTVDFLLLIFSVWNMEADSLCNLEVFRSQLVAGSCLCCKFYILDVSSSVPFWTVWTWWCTDLFDNIYCLWLLIKKKEKKKGATLIEVAKGSDYLLVKCSSVTLSGWENSHHFYNSRQMIFVVARCLWIHVSLITFNFFKARSKEGHVTSDWHPQNT